MKFLPSGAMCFACFLWFISSVNSAINLAMYRPAIQSSNALSVNHWADQSLANRAVDGNPSTCAYGGDGPGGPNWFAVDLGQQYYIQSVALTISDSNQYHSLDYFTVGVINEISSLDRTNRGTNQYPVCGQYNSSAATNVKMYQNCSANTLVGQFVVIQQPSNGTGSLTICELEVYGYSKLEDQLIGCYENILNFVSSQNQSSQTIQGCVKQCRDLLSTFAALQKGDRCLCANTIGNSTSVLECQLNCTGSPNQYCGGRQTYSIYTVCPIGYFGSSCTDRCHCADNKPCDIKSGLCSNGCNDIWNGSACNLYTPRSAVTAQSLGCFVDNFDRDLNGLWSTVSDNKQCFANCLNSGYLYFGTQYYDGCVCDIVYGKYGPSATGCDTPCVHTGEICGGAGRNTLSSIICPNGTYGSNCSKNCHCSNNSRCSLEGRCLSNKCEMGWKGTFCDVRNCSDNNGACGENEICQETDLKFTTVPRCECKAGYHRVNHWSKCTDRNECDYPTSCNMSTETCTNTVGSYYCTCKAGYYNYSTDGIHYSCQDVNECETNLRSCDTKTEICSNTIGSFRCTCLAGFNTTDFGKPNHCQDIDECLLGLDGCANETTICTNYVGTFVCQCRSGYERANTTSCKVASDHGSLMEQTDQSTGVGGKVAGAVIGTIAALAIIALVAIFVLRRWRRQGEKKSPGDAIDTQMSPVADVTESDSETAIDDRSPTRISIKELERYFKENSSTIERQYREVPTQTQDSCEYGRQPELKPKNRFKNVIPYDSNRVLLLSENGRDLSDYINASYILGYKSKRNEFIAAQGPNDHTVVDFWRMVCEQNVSVIVMVTNCIEEGKPRCRQYWPDSGKEIFGNVSVTVTKLETWPRFVIRTLQIETDDIEKEVIQLHYIAWPDHGVPDNIGDFLTFRRKVRARMTPNHLTIVHCSAGIGRTGAYLAVDYLLEQAKEEKVVDVQNCLKCLRDQRPQMIQTRQQYDFVYSALVTEFSLGDTTIPLQAFESTMKKLRKKHSGICRMEKQFNIISAETGDRESNTSLDYKFTIQLSASRVDAVYVSSFTKRRAFVVAQMPPNVSLEDFVKLCTNDSTFVVYLDDSPQDRLSFLPLDGTVRHDLTHSNVSICQKRQAEFGTPFSIFAETKSQDLYANVEEATYANSGCNTSDSTLLHVTKTHKSSLDYEVIAGVLRQIKDVLNDENYRGLLVLSRSDLELAGFFVAAINAMEMARLHNEVDIFQIVLELKKIQPTLISTHKSYEELHVCIGRYILESCDENQNRKSTYHFGSSHLSMFPSPEPRPGNVSMSQLALCTNVD